MAVVAVAAYVIGSLNSAIITVFVLKRKDIRDYGSNNAGLTNVYRCFGTTCAALTLAIDLLKGFAVVYGTKLALFGSGLFSDSEHSVKTACFIAAMFAVLGHVFPAFYGFKGGKGILIASMCTLAIDPLVFLFGISTMIIMTAATKYISVGSLACCFGFPFFVIIADLLTEGVGTSTYINAALAALMGVFCALRHISNIKRLIKHEENKFSFKKGKGDVS